MNIKSIALFGLLGACLTSIGAAQTSELKKFNLDVKLKVNPPVAGENLLDIFVTGPDGQPITGLKFKTALAMTLMDMGTEHPAVKEIGKGHYRAAILFSMEGPWRVNLRANSEAGMIAKSLDFLPGNKKIWVMPQEKPTVVATSPEKPTNSLMTPKTTAFNPDAMVKSPTPVSEVKSSPTTPHGSSPVKDDSGPSMKPSMTQSMEHSSNASMNHEGMRMAQAKETSVTVISGDEDWASYQGFGNNDPMVAMMNMMMVGGSGMEGMKMAPMRLNFGSANFRKRSDMSPADEPKGDLQIEAKLEDNPIVGVHALIIQLKDLAGKPIPEAKVSVVVSMTSIDMGSSSPVVKPVGDGKFKGKVTLSMAGPWRVMVKVERKGHDPVTKSFDFTAK